MELLDNYRNSKEPCLTLCLSRMVHAWSDKLIRHRVDLQSQKARVLERVHSEGVRMCDAAARLFFNPTLHEEHHAKLKEQSTSTGSGMRGAITIHQRAPNPPKSCDIVGLLQESKRPLPKKLRKKSEKGFPGPLGPGVEKNPKKSRK